MATMKPTTPLQAPQQGSAETGITSASTNCTKNAHFLPAKATAVSIPRRNKQAKAMAVSIPRRNKRAKAMAVSDYQATSPAAPRRDTHGRRLHHRQPNFARNLSRSFFNTPQKHCNSNDMNSRFETVAGELRAKLVSVSCGGQRSGGTRTLTPKPRRRCGGRRRDRRARLRYPRAVARPGRGAGGWRQGQGGPRDRPLRAFRLACDDLAGGPPPTGTHSGRVLRCPEHQRGHKHPGPPTHRAAAGDLSGQQATGTRHVGITKPPGPNGAGRQWR